MENDSVGRHGKSGDCANVSKREDVLKELGNESLACVFLKELD